MNEERDPSQISIERPENVEDDDSFYAHSNHNNHDKDKKSNEPHLYKHKEPKSKKKGIAKKKQRSTKQSKKSQMTKEKQKQMKTSQIAERKVEEIIEKMKDCYELDIRLFQQKKVACRKIGYIQELNKSLKNVYVCQKFVEKDGLSWFEKWMEKIIIGEISVQPSVSLRKGILQTLLNMSIGADNVSRTSEIQRLVARQKRSQIKELKDLSERIILKWNQLQYEQN